MQYVSSNGGPLVALPAEWAHAWYGTDASPGTPVPAGWEWSGDDDDPVRTDYDRACGTLRALHRSSYGGVGCLEVGMGEALVFSRPTGATFVGLDDGGAFLRNVTFPTRDAAERAVEAAPGSTETGVEIDLKDGRIFVFDSAYPHPGVQTALGQPTVLTAELTPGRYRVLACDYFPEGAGDDELYAYRLVRRSAG